MTSTLHTAERGVRPVTGMTAEQIGRLPWQPIAGCPGVYAKELWRHGDLVYALLWYEFGASTPGHPHPAADQHIWVIEGEALIGGRRLAAGSYAHIPPGTPHPIHAPGAGGCVLLQSHVHAQPSDVVEPVMTVSCQQ